MFRKPLRRILRLILFALSRWALNKHEPTVIAVIGEGKTGIVREAIYGVLKNHFPTRRNLETPDAEFVLPLTILGAKEYPPTILRWFTTVTKSIGQLLFLPKHKHFLVLEIGYTRKEVFDYFWKITQPEVLVICGNAPYLSKTQTAPKTVKVKDSKDLSGYLEAASKVGKAFGIPLKDVKKALANFTLPKARIRVLPARDGGIVIDATYQYFPPKEEALDEILEALPGKKIILSPKDLPSTIQEVRDGEVVALTGSSKKMWSILLQLTRKPWT